MPMRSHLRFVPKFLVCSVCNELVELETTMIDESGKPVHEECYVRRARANNLTQDDPNRTGTSNAREVIDFLNSVTTREVPKICPLCESQLERQEFTFLYKDRSWQIWLTRCPKCDPTAPQRATQPMHNDPSN
jgi:hypothetical protein